MRTCPRVDTWLRGAVMALGRGLWLWPTTRLAALLSEICRHSSDTVAISCSPGRAATAKRYLVSEPGPRALVGDSTSCYIGL